MQAALIGLPDTGPETGEAAVPSLAGRSVPARQVDLALHCGCELIVVHGHGTDPEIVRLRHRAEEAGARFQALVNLQSLPALVGAEDILLVMQPGLLAEAPAALEILSQEESILVVSAGPGMQAGLQRIDLDRAWAGLLRMPGAWLDRLDSLPPESATIPALLRIALQHRLTESRLLDSLLDGADWKVLTSQEQARSHENKWIAHHLPAVPAGSVSRWLAREALCRKGAMLLQQERACAIIVLAYALTLMAGVGAAWAGRPLIGFSILALGAPLAELAIGLARVVALPFGSPGWFASIRKALDIALFASAVLAIDGAWHREFFVPFVLASGLLLLDRRALPPLLAPLADRLVAASIVALAMIVATPEQALMLAAALVLLANLCPLARGATDNAGLT